jgi:hypothetical protein
MTAPSNGSVWTRDSWASPVPGGKSTMSTSSAPQSTFWTNCCIVFITMGPRHTTGVLSSTRKPMLMTLTPYFSMGTRRAAGPSPWISGRPWSPIMSGTLGP